MPLLTVVGGPNGAGKSTFVRSYQDAYDHPYLSADRIAADLRPEDPTAVRIAAGRQFLRALRTTIDEGRDAIVETTLAGRGFLHHLDRARSAGFTVRIVFVFLDSPEQAVRRVRQRVEKGGHPVPRADVHRRFQRSISNFWSVYRQQAHRWHLYYNAGGVPALVASGADDIVEVFNPALLTEFKTLAAKP